MRRLHRDGNALSRSADGMSGMYVLQRRPVAHTTHVRERRRARCGCELDAKRGDGRKRLARDSGAVLHVQAVSHLPAPRALLTLRSHPAIV